MKMKLFTVRVVQGDFFFVPVCKSKLNVDICTFKLKLSHFYSQCRRFFWHCCLETKIGTLVNTISKHVLLELTSVTQKHKKINEEN